MNLIWRLPISWSGGGAPTEWFSRTRPWPAHYGSLLTNVKVPAADPAGSAPGQVTPSASHESDVDCDSGLSYCGSNPWLLRKACHVAPNLFIALTNPIEGEDDAFNKWYDAQHVPEVLDVPGVVAAQRYDITELKVPDDEDLPAQLPPPTHRYMVIYELDNEPDVVMAEFLKRVMAGTLTLGEWLDLTTVSLTGWTPRGERVQADR